MKYFNILFFLFFLTAPSLAALPPVSENERQSNSSHVLEGEILRIFTREKEKNERKKMSKFIY